MTHWPARAALSLLVLAPALCASRAHEFLAGYIQHQVEVSVGSRDIDVTIRLSFFEDGSEHERGHMDLDADGSVSHQERHEYIQSRGASWDKAVSLRVAGQEVPLMALFPAELDLLGHDQAGRGHHRLTLHLFARTPAELVAGTEVTVGSTLWSDLRALAAIRAEGRDGCRMEPRAFADPILPPARENQPREFTARVLVAPKRGTEARRALSE